MLYHLHVNPAPFTPTNNGRIRFLFLRPFLQSKYLYATNRTFLLIDVHELDLHDVVRECSWITGICYPPNLPNISFTTFPTDLIIVIGDTDSPLTASLSYPVF
jgi:hypothetical protein